MTRQFEIYYHDLNTEAKAELLAEFNTKPDDENWDVIPLTVITRENGEYFNRHNTDVKADDRIAEWNKFAQHMEEYIRERTLQKYSMNNGNGVDMMTMTDSEICIWNILKYALRLHNGKSKEHDLEKVAHYACLAWSKMQVTGKKSNMKLVKNGK